MTSEKTISGHPISEIPAGVLREFWLSDQLTTEEYMEEKTRRDRAYISVSREDVRALLLGHPKEEFTAALVRLASWFEGRPVDIDALPYSPSPVPREEL